MRRYSTILAIASVLCAGFLSGGIMAEGEPSAMGYWKGSVEYPSGPMEINTVFLQNKAGEWAGVIGIPSQGIRNLRLNRIDIQGSALTFGVEGINGDPMFTGDLAADGQTISGTLAQAGQTFIFSLQRSDDPIQYDSHVLEPYEKPGVAGKGLAGTWLGLLEREPARIRMVMTISEGADGTLSGTMRSPDQGDKEVPIDSISIDGKAVTMSLDSLYAIYQAEMNGDGSAIYGSWEQTGYTMNLNFKRQAGSGK